MGIDFNISDKDLDKIYRSIDISKVLIVLEDLERTQINLKIDLLMNHFIDMAVQGYGWIAAAA